MERARSHQEHTVGEPSPQAAEAPLFKGAKGSAMEKTAVARALLRLAKRIEADGGRKLTPHDLRRTFRALLSRVGVSPEVAEACMGDAERPTAAGAYDARIDAAQVAAWNGIGAHLAAIRG